MRSPRKRAVLLLVSLVVAFPVAGRLHAWWSAVRYGHAVSAAFPTVGSGGLTDTAELRAFLNRPEVKMYHNRADRLKFLGGGYGGRIGEFNAGLIYLSEQAALAMDQRFTSPPALESFSLDTRDRTQRGVINACVKLIEDYNRQAAVP